MKDYQTQIPDLLAHGIRVLIYAGDQVCAVGALCPLGPVLPLSSYAPSFLRASTTAPIRFFSGLHMQLAGQPGVDAGHGVAWQGWV